MISPLLHLSQDYTLSAATIADTMELEQLVNSAYRGDDSKIGWTTEADLMGGARVTAISLQNDLNNTAACIYTCRNLFNKLDGCIYLQVKANKLYVGMLSVTPGLQNKGIGKLLLKAAEVVALANNCIALTMTVISVRTALIDWYKRHGYQPTGEVLPFDFPAATILCTEPLQFIVLEKLLTV